MNRILEAKDIYKSYDIGKKHVRILEKVSIELNEGETLSIVGESGSGKSTLARLITRLEPLDEGRVFLDGMDLSTIIRKKLRKDLQIVFQDSSMCLDPKMTIKEILIEPILLHSIHSMKKAAEKAEKMIELIGLSADDLEKFPDEFSGGQKQRIMIARSLMAEPRILVLDEPVSSLDVSVQSQILNLLSSLKQTLGLSYVMIAHDLSIVRHMSDRVAVIYLGKIVETAPSEILFTNPLHPYTKLLMDSYYDIDHASKKEFLYSGEMPSLENRPKGCVFSTRCPHTFSLCQEFEPNTIKRGDSMIACHLQEIKQSSLE